MKLTKLIQEQKELRALAAAIASRAEEAKRGLNAEEEKRMSDLTSQISALDAQIDAEIRSTPVNVPNIPSQPEARDGGRPQLITLRQALGAMAGNMELRGMIEKRAMASSVGGIPKFIEEILDAVAEANPMRDLAEVYTFPGDASIPVPGLPTAAFGAEGATITPADASVTNVALSVFNLQGGITINDALMEDDFFNIKKMIAQGAGAKIGEVEGTSMLDTGAGASQPQGLFNHAIDMVTAATGVFDKNDLNTFINSVETKWLKRGNLKFLFSPGVLAKIIGLKDNTGWLEVDTKARTVQGIPYVLTSLAPGWAATVNYKIMALGDFKRGYAIGQRTSDMGAIKTKVVPSATAFASNVLFNERIDGRIVDPAAFKVLAIK
jgi:HK97 family phage major capsid protein